MSAVFGAIAVGKLAFASIAVREVVLVVGFLLDQLFFGDWTTSEGGRFESAELQLVVEVERRRAGL